MNVMKKRNEPYVEQSLEATRSIEYQLLNMKNELEKFSTETQDDLDISPAVTHTLETLQHIDSQLQNMRALLENYSSLLGDKEGKEKFKETIQKLPKPSPPPFPPTSPETYPPTYPKSEEYYPPTTPQYPPMGPPEMQRQYYYPPMYNPFLYYYFPPPYFMPGYSNPYYGDPRVFPQDYPPFLPPYGYYPEEDYEQGVRYYESKKYPTVASSEPAHSSRSRATPSQIFRIAYYPWEHLTGKRSPMDSRVPYINLYDLGKEYLMFVELPGVEKENIEIRVDSQSVWINGKPTIIGGEDGTPIVQEHGYHEFSRQLVLPSTVINNKTTCDFENGILKIILIKETPKKLGHKVKIK